MFTPRMGLIVLLSLSSASFAAEPKPLTAEQVQDQVAALKDPAPAKRKDAILALANGGIAAKAAESALIRLLNDTDRAIRLLAAYALEKLENAR